MVLDKNDNVDISVLMLTYNHGKYIRQALDSVLCQQIKYSYEIVVGDDNSTDETREILLEYKKKYPEIIQLILRNENIGATKNAYGVLMSCRGKYIALLEGDDYWIDPLKLQKQVSFLEIHSEFIATVHSVSVYCDDPKISWYRKVGWYCNEGMIYTFENYKKQRYASHFCSVVFRNIYRTTKKNYEIIYKADNMTCDRTFNLILVAQGNIYCFEDVMSVYRLVIKNGCHNVNSLYKNQNVIYKDFLYECKLNEYCKREFKKSFLGSRDIAKRWIQATKSMISNRREQDKKVFYIFSKMLSKDVVGILCIPLELLKLIFNRIKLLYIRIRIELLLRKNE